MKPNAPKRATWMIGLIVGILGIAGHYVPDIPVVSADSFWFVTAGFVVLALGTSFKGL